MFKNYFKMTLRNFKKNKGYSFINISGLAIGMACCILILLWVQDELSYDRFHKNSSDLYRVLIEDRFPDGRTNRYGVAPTPLGPAFKAEFPEVVNATRYRRLGRMAVKFGENYFNENYFVFVDPSFFQVFTFPFLEGDPGAALSKPGNIVITESMAKKYFGDLNPLGKTLNINNQFDFTVTGVTKDVPPNSHFTYDFLVPYENIKLYGRDVNDWTDVGTYTFLQMQKNVNPDEFTAKIRQYIKKRTPESITELLVQPITDIHLHSQNIFGMGGDGDIKYVYIFSLIALFVLLIACINFMNLTTARSGKRSREVGMRKVTGATKKDLIFQFFGESLWLSFTALLLAVVLVILLLPTFSTLSGKQFSANLLTQTGILLWMVVIALFTGVIAGIYPALYLSSFQPVEVLKGGALSSAGKGKSILRKILVVTQFTISIILITGTLVVYHQLNFMRNQSLGYDKDHLFYINMPGNLAQKYDAIRNELLTSANIADVTSASDLPHQVRISTHGADWEGKNPTEQVEMKLLYVGYDFPNTLQLQMAQGRFFSKEFSTDKNAYILNETAIKAMGMESPLGKWFQFNEKGPIVGIVKDFHFASLHQTILPLIMVLAPEQATHFIIRIKSRNVPDTIDFIKEKWAKLAPGFPLEFGFVDELIDNLYRGEQRIGEIFRYFTILSILISCLGLFGLASFMAEQRSKEIGIRKVMGATIKGIVYLLSKEFVKWVIIANIIAWPITYIFMKQWLQNFAYRIPLGIGSFLFAGILAVLIALVTVGYQTVKAASANPIKSLKYE
jgi:putative ABC transport system permease protein